MKKKSCILFGSLLLICISPVYSLAEAEQPSQQTDVATAAKEKVYEQKNEEKKLLTLGTKSKKTKTSSDAQLGEDVPSMSEMTGKAIKGVLYCSAVLFLLYGLYKKFLEPKATGSACSIDLISRRPLGPKASLLLVEVEGQKLLLAQTPEDVKLLTQLDPAPTFQDALGAATRKEFALADNETKVKANG